MKFRIFLPIFFLFSRFSSFIVPVSGPTNGVWNDRLQMITCANVIRTLCPDLDHLPVSLFLQRRQSQISLLYPLPHYHPFITFLLLLCGDVHTNPGPVIYSPPSINFGHLNIRSAASVSKSLDKPAILKELIADDQIEILSLNETWFSPNDHPSVITSITPENYSVIHEPRQSRRGGGVAFVFASYLNLEKVVIPCYNSFEALLVKCTISQSSFFFLTIYRPPPSTKHSSPFLDFLSDFSSLLENLLPLSSELIITGDFNIHVNDPSNPHASNFIDLLNSFDLHQHVNFSTHTSGNTLDLLISRSSSNIIQSVDFLVPALSDHYALLTAIQLPKKPRMPRITKFIRRLKSIDLHSFKADLLRTDVFCSPSSDASMFADQLCSSLTNTLDKHAPLIKITVPTRKSNPWFTEEIRSAKRLRSHLETIFRKTHLSNDFSAFKAQAKKVSKLISSSKSKFFRSTISKLRDQPRNLWSTLNSLLDRKPNATLPTHSSPSGIAQAFIEFFNNKITLLCSKLPVVSCSPFTDPPQCPPILSDFKPATVAEISKLIKAVPDTTCLLDCIPTTLLKSCLDILAEPLTELINLCLSQGCFPDSFKIAHVKPLLKKFNLPSEDFSNYRPISNLSFISKIIERVVHSRLLSHVNSFATFSPFQSAYRKFHSTETALLKIQDDILLAFENQKLSALVLLDLSAAFDTIDHSILLHRLKSWFGLSGTVLEFFTSYLTNRSQCVNINGCLSSPVPLLTGIPQGSVLGPLLFTLYTTPVAHVMQSKSVNFHFYADDTQLYVSFSPESSSSELNNLLNTLNLTRDWFISNRLFINPSKTEFMILGTNPQMVKLPQNSLELSFGEAVLTPVQSVRNLGILFDTDLSFQSHFSKLSQSCFAFIRHFRRIRNSLDMQSSIILANAFISSKIDYCNSLFFGLPKCSLRRLQTIQNTVARIVIPSKKSDHITPILRKLHWLPIEQRIKFKIATLTFKILTNQHPSYLQELLVHHQPYISTRSADKFLLEIPYRRTESGRRAFSYASPYIWNSLPLNIRSASSLSSFRRCLKTFLFPP